MKQIIIWVCLILYGCVLWNPLLTAWAEKLPYEAPKYKEYKPNVKPMIPQGIKVKPAKKPNEQVKKDDDEIDWFSWGNLGIYTQVIWNVFGDVIPASYGKAYVQKYKLLKIYKTNSKGDLRIGGRKQIPYWLTRWRWLNKADWTIFRGKIDLGKWIYARIEGYHLRLQEYGLAGLTKGKRYTPTEFNQSEYVKNQQAFHPQMKTSEFIGKGVSESKNVLQEALLIGSEATKKVEWWKLTGRIGMGFSFLITTLDYTIGSNKDKGIASAEFIAALPLDFFIGTVIAFVSSIAVTAIAAFAVALFEISIPAIVIVGAVLAVGFVIGLAVENLPFFKTRKDKIHGFLTNVVQKGYHKFNNGLVTIPKLGALGKKVTSGMKLAKKWVARKFGW